MVVEVFPIAQEAIAEQIPRHYQDRNPGFSLDPDIEAKIISPAHIKSIASIRALSYSEYRQLHGANEIQTGYDVLRISLSLGGRFGFEREWHGTLVIRKKHTDKDWKNGEVFYALDETPVASLAWMPDREMEKHLKRYGGEQTPGHAR